MIQMPSGAYGDSMGGMTIAGGVAAALYARKTTGETSVVDVSLLGVGAWATQFSVNLAMVAGGPLPVVKAPKHGAPTNPLTGAYKTSDDRWVMLTMLQPAKFWPDFCAVVGRPELGADPRFTGSEKIMANAGEAAGLVAEIFATRTYDEWITVLAEVKGPWATVQNAWDVANDESLNAVGMIADIVDFDGNPQRLVANPVQFDETPVTLTRAPQFAEHTDDIIRELGHDDDELIQYKIAGAVT